MTDVMYDPEAELPVEDEANETEAAEPVEGAADLQKVLANIKAANLAEDLDDGLLSAIGAKVVEEYEIDENSRKESGWIERVDAAMKLALLAKESKDYPWPNASNVKFPLIIEAAIKFNARAYPAVVDGPDIVKGAVKGKLTPEKSARADRVGKHMSYQLLEEMDDWEEDTDRLLMQDFTMEGMRGVLANNRRGKVLIAVSELSAVFGNLDAFSNSKNGASKDSPKLLQLYESKSLLVDRAPPAPPVHVKSWAASISGAIQPSIFTRLVGKMNMTEDGMLARFLLVNSRAGNAGEDRPVDKAAADRYKRMLANVVKLQPGEQPCNLSPEAQEVRTGLLEWIYRTAGAGVLADGLAAAVGKFEGSFARICLVMHACECADAGLSVIAPEVSMDTAHRAQAFILELLYPHAARFYRDLGHGSQYVKVPSYVAGFILATEAKQIQLTQIWHALSIWRHIERRQQNDAMQTLLDSGWLTGKTGSRYNVNPLVHDLYPAQAEKERERRSRYADILNRRLGREPGSD